MGQIFKQSDSIAARRRFYLYLVDATDGITPETGEAGGQPQISKNGGAWENTSATLTAVGNGTYYVELTIGELDTLGGGSIRYKSENTAEFSEPFTVMLDPFGDDLAGDVASIASDVDDVLNDTTDILNAVSDIPNILAAIAALQASSDRTNGLLHENAMIDQTVFDETGLMISARLRVFANAGAVPLTHGGNEGTEVQRYAITATAGPNGMTSYKLVRQL